MRAWRCLAIVGGCSLVVCSAMAGIPEPDAILYGRVCLGGRAISAQEDVTILGRVAGVPEVVASYHMGDQGSAGDNYVLRIRLETPVEGFPLSPNAAAIGQTVKIMAKQGTGAERQVATLLVDDRGVIRQRSLSDGQGTDVDADRDSDLRDFARLQNCFTGTGPVTLACRSADLNNDSKVDLADYKNLAVCSTGPQ